MSSDVDEQIAARSFIEVLSVEKDVRIGLVHDDRQSSRAIAKKTDPLHDLVEPSTRNVRTSVVQIALECSDRIAVST